MLSVRGVITDEELMVELSREITLHLVRAADFSWEIAIKYSVGVALHRYGIICSMQWGTTSPRGGDLYVVGSRNAHKLPSFLSPMLFSMLYVSC